MKKKKNDGVSKRVHELAFGIIICFGAEAWQWPGKARAAAQALRVKPGARP